MSKLADAIRKRLPEHCSAVVVAAGSSLRMGSDKMMMRLGGMPVLARTLRVLNGCACVEEIVLVVREDMLEAAARLCRDYGVLKVTKVVCGGKTRTESALAGVSAIRSGAKLVMIHDGARPLVTEKLIREVVHAAAIYHCAAPAIAVNDTIKTREGARVGKTLDRDSLVAIQTPQVFEPLVIKAALSKAVTEGIQYTDDCAAAEALGAKIRLTEGSAENIKITRPVDIGTAEAILAARGQTGCE